MLFTIFVLIIVLGAVGIAVFFLYRMYESIKDVEETQAEKDRNQEEINKEIEAKLKKALDIEHMQKLERKIKNLQDIIDSTKSGVENMRSSQLEEIAEKVREMEGQNEEDILKVIVDMEDKLSEELKILTENHGSMEKRIDTIENVLSAEGDYESWDEFVKNADDQIEGFVQYPDLKKKILDAKTKVADYIINYDKNIRKKLF